ncbi:MAG: polysaccharide biosynthesis protein [Lachnospiraceae bacterium]|nr:polysaccharide biosynthesis protein [Lachnospiraceae bacterium]
MSTNKTNQNLLMQGSILAAASIIVRLIGLLYRVPMNNILGESGMGLYSLAYEIYNLGLILSSYSLPLAVSKMVSAKVTLKEYKNVRRILVCSLSFAVVSGTLMSGILFFGADLIAKYVFATPNMALPLQALAPTVLVFSVMGVIRGLFQGMGTMIPTSFSQIIEQVVHAIVSVALPAYIVHTFATSPYIDSYAAAGGTTGTFLGALAAFGFLLFVFYLYRPTFRKQIRRDKTGAEDSYQDIFKLMIATIIPIILSQTVYQLSGTVDGSIFSNISEAAGIATSEREALWGIYSGYYRLLTNVPVAIASALGASAIPSIVASRVKGDEDAVHSQIKATIKFNMLIAIPAAAGMTFLAEPILAILFPRAGELAVKCLTIGSIAVVFFSLSTVSSSILQGIDLMKKSVVNSAISLVLHIILIFIMLKFLNLGVIGLVIGNVTFALVVCILNWLSIGRALGYKQEVKTTFLLPAVCSLIMGFLCLVIYKAMMFLCGIVIISFAVAFMMALIIYATLLLLFHVLTEEEIKEMPLGTKMYRLLVKIHVFEA